MSSDGVIYQDFWQWEILDMRSNPRIVLHDATQSAKSSGIDLTRLCRLGACTTWTSSPGLLVIGGVTAQELLPEEAEIVCLTKNRLDIAHPYIFNYRLEVAANVSGRHRPLLIGHSACTSRGRTLIAGGGAVCFSFGTFWNTEYWTLASANETTESVWTSVEPQTLYLTTGSHTHVPNSMLSPGTNPPAHSDTTDSVPSTKVEIERDFERIVNNRKPVILRDLELGHCTAKWSLAYLKSTIGADRPVWLQTPTSVYRCSQCQVVVHEAGERHMSFQAKNFRYSTKPFGDFVDQITDGSMQYLRSLALNKPSEQPANFATDFPQLAPDFTLPPSLELVTRNAHSSPLRISGPVTMWLHYDVRVRNPWKYSRAVTSLSAWGRYLKTIEIQCSLQEQQQ